MKRELLRAEFITKTIEGSQVLSGCNLILYEGEVQGLIGLNLSGKSVLMKALCGVTPGCEGNFFLNGEQHKFFRTIGEARRHGVFYIQDESWLVSQWSAAENIFIWSGSKRNFSFFIRRRSKAEATYWMDFFRCTFPANAPIVSLTSYDKLKLFLAKAMFQKARLIALDYPFARLNHQQLVEFSQLIAKIKARNVSLFIVDYDYSRLLPVLDSVVIMRAGKTVARLPQNQVSGKELRLLMAGFAQEEATHPVKPVVQNQYFIAQNLVGPDISGISFELSSGEIVSLIDGIGNSNLHLADVLTGRTPIYSGTLTLDGQVLHLQTAADAQRKGIYCIRTTQQQDLLFPDMPLEDNVLLPVLQKHSSKLSVLRRSHIQLQFDILASHIFKHKPLFYRSKLSALSQLEYSTLLLLRQALVQPKLLVLYDCFSKLDHPAKQELYTHIRNVADTGTAILIVTMNPDEAILASDRILITGAAGILKEIDNHNNFGREEILAVINSMIHL